MSKFTDLAARLGSPDLTLDELRGSGVTPDDLRKLRMDEGSFVARASGDTPKAKAERTFTYVMSTENPVGFFRDVVKVNGWDLDDFKKRQQPFLFGHNASDDRLPLGRMSGLKKGRTVKGALTGDAEFTPEGVNQFNDVAHDMVEAGFMPGGSVGFNVLEARKPTTAETKAMPALNEFSSIITRAQLVEFSAVPVGMDPDAVKIRTATSTGMDEHLRRCIEEGRYSRELVAAFRHDYLGVEPESVRTQVPVEADLEDEPADVMSSIAETPVISDGDLEGSADSPSTLADEELARSIESITVKVDELTERVAALTEHLNGDTVEVAEDEVQDSGEAPIPESDLFDLYLSAFGDSTEAPQTLTND